MTSVGNRTPDLLISGPPPYQLGHEILPNVSVPLSMAKFPCESQCVLYQLALLAEPDAATQTSNALP